MNTEPKSIEALDERLGYTSASNAELDELCPGRFLAQRGLPGRDGEYAQTGRRVHEALAGRFPPEGLSFNERETFDSCQRIEHRLLAKFKASVRLQDPAGLEPVGQCVREERMWVCWDRIGKEWKHSGKPDVVHYYGNAALVVEYKTLWGDIPGAPSNKQLRDQVMLVDRNGTGLHWIWCVVIQPNVTDEPEICMYTRESLNRAWIDVRARVEASWNPESPRLPGNPQCDHCLAKTRCLEYQKWAGALIPGMLGLLDVPVELWTQEQRAIFCEREIIARKWLQDTKDAMKHLLAEDPASVPGWYLKPGAVRSIITNPTLVFERFQKLGGKLEQFMATLEVKKQKLREQIHQVTGARGGKLESALDAVVLNLTEEKRNEPTLARVKAGPGESEADNG